MKRKKVFKTMLRVAASGLILVSLASCGKQEAALKTELDEVQLPVEEDVTLTIWANNIHTVVKNYSEMGVYQKLKELTGISVDFIHPVANQAAEQFNIMIASKDYPDIIEGLKQNYSGGFVKAYEDGVILELTELMNKCAPNLKGLYDTYPQLMMESENDRGQLFAVPMIRGGNILRTYRGPIVRADYLKKFGLEAPETMEDWYNMLTTFKNNGIELPFTSVNYFFNTTEPFVGAYGINFNFFLEDGKVKYGPLDDRFKDFVVEMAKWYREGLIDPEITTNDQKILDSKVMNTGAGSFIGTTGNSLGGYISEMSSKNPEFDLVAVQYPVLNKGDEPYFIQRDPTVQLELGSSITTTCEHPEYAMAFLDYAFSKEGNLLFNFGVEGESYEMVDGYPVFTDQVKHNPDGLSFAKAGSLYARSFTSGTFVQDPRYGEQFYAEPRQQESLATWTKSLDKVVEKNTRIIGDLTPEESEEISPLLNEINTYAGEMFIKWVMGRSDVEADFADYQEQLRKLGIEKCIEYRQKAYDRYVDKFPEMKQPKDIEVSDYFWK